MAYQADAMTPTRSATPSTNDHTASNDQYRVIRKRNRVPLSCAPCRNRKLKCNRSTPCENCVKRSEASMCSYAAPGGRRKAASKGSLAETPDVMQNRIDRLEGLVLSLMTNGSSAPGPTAAVQALNSNSRSESGNYTYSEGGPMDDMSREEDGEGESETDQVANSLGVLQVANNRSMYVGDSHWATVLSDIAEVRNYWTEHKKQYEDQTQKVEATKKENGANNGPAFLFGGRNLPQLSELAASLPGRDAVDKLVDRYFNDYDGAIHIIHPASWRRMYERHWTDPSKTDAAFLGQLFAICCLAMYSFHKAGKESEPYEYQGRTLSLASNYRQLTAQCLLLADFSKPVNNLLETMILHLYGEFSKSREAEVGVWVLIGMIVRLAMRMGLHRDPKYYPSLTPFQGEMRRRLWTFVRQSDLLFSFQLSLPSMIRLGDCDTALPRNIYDDEFDEDSKTLPPSRPPSTVTPVSYMIAKSVLSFAFGKIVERLHSLRPLPYDEIMTLDNELRESYASIPPFLRFKPLEDSLMETTTTLIMRFNSAMLYNKGQCVLHRRYLVKARENPRYNHSRRTCMDSSLELLRYQATLHLESRPGRRLHSLKWYINSLTTHDFLLAATLVALDLWHSAQAESRGRSTGDREMWGEDRRVEMIESIKSSRDIWVEISDHSMEAYKAGEILSVMLKKLEDMHYQTENRKALNAFHYNKPADNSARPPPHFGGPDEEKPEHSAAITLGMLSTGALPLGQQPAYNGPYVPTPGGNANIGEMLSVSPSNPTTNLSDPQTGGATTAPSPFSLFTNSSEPMENLDWDAWDSYVQNTNIDPANDVWPTGFTELPSPDLQVMDPQLQQAGNGFGLPRDITMGVDTPPGGTNL